MIEFSDKEGKLFGFSPKQVATEELARQRAQEKLSALFEEQPNEQFHVLTAARRGAGAGGGDVNASWMLQSTEIQWCQ